MPNGTYERIKKIYDTLPLNLKNQDFRTLKGNHGKDFSTLSCLFNVKDHCALKPRGPINDQLPGCLWWLNYWQSCCNCPLAPLAFLLLWPVPMVLSGTARPSSHNPGHWWLVFPGARLSILHTNVASFSIKVAIRRTCAISQGQPKFKRSNATTTLLVAPSGALVVIMV